MLLTGKQFAQLMDQDAYFLVPNWSLGGRKGRDTDAPPFLLPVHIEDGRQSFGKARLTVSAECVDGERRTFIADAENLAIRLPGASTCTPIPELFPPSPDPDPAP
jgi:hypothetical protein